MTIIYLKKDNEVFKIESKGKLNNITEISIKKSEIYYTNWKISKTNLSAMKIKCKEASKLDWEKALIQAEGFFNSLRQSL